MPLNEKQKIIKNNFEYHARIAAHNFAEKYHTSPQVREMIYQAIMAFMDSAFEREKIAIKAQNFWDEAETEFQQAMKEEGIRRGEVV